MTSTPEGITCGVDNGVVAGDCAAPFAEGTVVVLSQAPEPGSEFMAWGGACSGATCSVTLSEDRTVSATFDFTDRVLVSGTVTVKQTFLVDLDVGAANEDAEKEGWDLWFEAETAIRRYLTPWAPAELAFAGRSAPGRRGCAEADLGSGRVQLFPESPAGTFLCVVTNEGRLAEVEILAAPTASPGTIPLRFRTWATPVR